MISAYEKKREENIRRNQEILASLDIPKLVTNQPQKIKTLIVQNREKKKKEKIISQRQSKRIIERLTGVKTALPKTEFIVVEEKKEKLPRIISKIPFEPTIRATQDFISTINSLSNTHQNLPQFSFDLNFKHRHSIVKCAQDRIYSMSFMQSIDKVIAVGGTKFGNLVFWDATEILQDDYLPPKDEELDKNFIPKVFSFTPHPDHSISNIKVVDNYVFTSSYDATIKKMDVEKGCFIPLFTPSLNDNKNRKLDEWIICGMDFYNHNEFIISDVDGRVGELDFRIKSPLINIHSCSEKKIGGLSLKENYIATSSNDGSVSIWDRRYFKNDTHPIHIFQYNRAVTSVHFHPINPNYLVSTCYDDHIRIHNLLTNNTIEKAHNNQTGRWITPFKAIWDPKSAFNISESMILIGNMNRGLDIFDGNGKLYKNLSSEYVTAQPAVNVGHPYMPIVASGNASGKITIWSN